MALCEFSGRCPIYQRKDEEQWRANYAERFCVKCGKDCERKKMRYYSGDPVPQNLLPDGSLYKKSIFEVD